MNMKVIRLSKIAFDIMFVVGLIGIVLVAGLTVLSPIIVDAIRESNGLATSGDFFG
ncbi:MAG: hypothetical protein JJE47_18125, partial [Acidimicrobiia bacterium]|nr:hypothetical protein [Acidimicrobiia bacterium]